MNMFKGLTTMVLTADDVDAAARWYSKLFQIEPYFRQPTEGAAAYVEFRLGPDEDELGIMDRSYAPDDTRSGGSSITYWHVADVEAAVTELINQGATIHMPPTQRAAEFVTASVLDPFGNVVGLMYSPHWSAKH